MVIRIQSISSRIAIIPGSAATNADGRPDTISYPSGLVLKYVYTALGYLSAIKDNATGTAYWTANAADAELHVTAQTFGNGASETQSFDANTGLIQQILAGTSNGIANFHYGWDVIGNLTSRADTYQGTTEQFCYDALNRLTNYALGASCTATGTKTVAYDSLGNITSKSDVGSYLYPAAGQARPLNHSDIRTTLRYAHVLDSEVAAALEAVAESRKLSRKRRHNAS